jgi:GNAT superfamily N-acetyltransferase
MKPSVTSLLISKLATSADIDTITNIVIACANSLLDRHFEDWSNYYSRARLADKLTTQLAYLFYFDDKAVGVVFLQTNDLYYYSATDLSKFSSPNDKAVYIGTLAVHPQYQGRGIASQIIKFCEEYCRQNKISSLRLDHFGGDKLLTNFYLKNGFSVVSPMEKEPEYILMQKIIGS